MFQKPIAEILTIHRVGIKTKRGIKAFMDLTITPEFLEKKIETLKMEGYRFISIDYLFEILSYNLKLEDKKLIVLTIDDGYKDTFDVTYPILVKNNIPFTFYVANAFPDKKILLWWDYLNDLIINKSLISLKNGYNYTCNTPEQKQRTYIDLSKKLLRMGNKIDVEFAKLFNVRHADLLQNYKHLLIDWEDISTMSFNSLCTIGAHSSQHFGLRFSSISEIKKDIIRNKSKMNEITGKTISHFAYPYGTHYSVGNREYSIVKKLNFKTAVVTYSSPVFKYHQNQLLSLPRIQLSDEEQ